MSRIKPNKLRKRKNEITLLKERRVPLTPEERKLVMESKAVWHHGPNGEETPAVWKSKHPQTVHGAVNRR